MHTLEKTLRWIVIASIFLLPFVCLIVATSLFFPYITGKNFAFRLIVEIMTGAWLALALVNTNYRPRNSWVLWTLLIFVGIIAITDALGAYPAKSFWSNYERMDGWVTLAHLALYTLVAASVLHKEKLWRWLFWTNLGVSVYLSIYGLFQLAGVSALGQGGAAGLGARIDATFGNPIYLAVYMLFNIFIAALLWSQQWHEKGRGGRLPMSLAYGTVITLDTLALLFTGTRGTTLGLIGGTVLALLIVALLGSKRKVAIGGIVVAIVLGGGFWMARDAAWVQRIGFMQRLATISTSDNTVKARFINWSIAWQGIQERPILGWGQENYALVFDKYYDPRMYAQEPWFDRVHNIVFDWLIAGGFVGLLSYLAVFVASLWGLWRGRFTLAERAILTGLLAGYFCHNLFVFDNVTSYIWWGTILAYIAWRNTEDTDIPHVFSRFSLSHASLPYVTVAAVLLVWFGAWYVNAHALAANRLLLQGMGAQQAGVAKNLDLMKQALALNSYGNQEIREQLTQATTQIVQAANIPVQTKQDFYQTAVSEMQKQEAVSPLDARFPLFLGILHTAAGQYAAAKESLERALADSPHKQTILYELGENAILRKDPSSALAYYKTALDLAPENTLARIEYAAAAIRVGQGALADQLLAPIVATGDAADPRIASAYLANKQYGKIATIWEARVKARPDEAQARFTLAAAYYGAGNSAKAIAVLEGAKSLSQEIAAQADSLIQEIRSGTAKLE